MSVNYDALGGFNKENKTSRLMAGRDDNLEEVSTVNKLVFTHI